jgi:hypothetical protein
VLERLEGPSTWSNDTGSAVKARHQPSSCPDYAVAYGPADTCRSGTTGGSWTPGVGSPVRDDVRVGRRCSARKSTAKSGVSRCRQDLTERRVRPLMPRVSRRFERPCEDWWSSQPQVPRLCFGPIWRRRTFGGGRSGAHVPLDERNTSSCVGRWVGPQCGATRELLGPRHPPPQGHPHRGPLR